MAEPPARRRAPRGINLITVLFLCQGVVTWYFMPLARWSILSHVGKAIAFVGFFGFATLARIALLQRNEWRERANKPVIDAVIDTGVYGIVRHPTYVGYMVCSTGLAMVAQHWSALTIGAVIVGVIIHAVFREERENLVRFGESYREYMRRVPRINVFVGAYRRARERTGA